MFKIRNNLLWLSVYFNYATSEICTFEQYRGFEDEIIELNCEGSNFTSIDSERLKLFKNVTKFMIKRTKLLEIPHGIEFLTNLKYFHFTMNEVGFDVNSISRLTNLKKLTFLNLNDSGLTRFPPYLCQIKNLAWLTLNNNLIEILPPEIENLSNLEYLNLNNNLIDVLPGELFTLKRLENLHISNNNLKNLEGNFLNPERALKYPLGIGSLRNLNHLELNHNELTEIPYTFWNLIYLKELDISSNQITSIHPRICVLKNLISLNLSENKLTSFPEDLKYLSCLHTLSLSDNMLNSLPKQLTKFWNLRYLDLSRNKFKNVPEILAKLSNLLHLYIGNNEISEIPDYFKRLSKLTRLSLMGNLFKTFPLVLCSFSHLEFLDFSDNEIQSLPIEFIKPNKNKNLNIDLRDNCIYKENPPYGLGVESIKKIKWKSLFISRQQKVKFRSIDEVKKIIAAEKVHWDINKLNETVVSEEITGPGLEMSDKTLRKIYRTVLKYIVYDPAPAADYATESSEEECTDKTNQILTELKDPEFKHLFIRRNVLTQSKPVIPYSIDTKMRTSISLRRKISYYLRWLDEPTSEEKKAINLKSKMYLKTIFYHFLQMILDKKNLYDIKVSLTNLVENSLVKCEVGQIEGLKYYYSLYILRKNPDTILDTQSYIELLVAAIKENCFSVIGLETGFQTVHSIKAWRQTFKDIIGIQCDYEDPYELNSKDNNTEIETASLLYNFFELFTIDRVCSDITEEINKEEKRLREVFELLKDYEDKKSIKKFKKILGRNRKILDDILYANNTKTTRKYFEYVEIPGFDELEYKKIKKEGVYTLLMMFEFIKEMENPQNDTTSSDFMIF